MEEKRLKKIEADSVIEKKVLNVFYFIEIKSFISFLFQFEPKSIFHLEQDGDYQGRSYLDPSSSLKNVEHTSFIPKKLIHTYIGHTKPVQVIKFFPKYGHFLLSCSLDCQV